MKAVRARTPLPQHRLAARWLGGGCTAFHSSSRSRIRSPRSSSGSPRRRSLGLGDDPAPLSPLVRHARLTRGGRASSRRWPTSSFPPAPAAPSRRGRPARWRSPMSGAAADTRRPCGILSVVRDPRSEQDTAARALVLPRENAICLLLLPACSEPITRSPSAYGHTVRRLLPGPTDGRRSSRRPPRFRARAAS